MAVDFKLPDLGENVESGDIVNVLVKEGDEVQANQSVFEVETGKAILRDRILECAGDVGLPDDIVERLGSVFAGENLVAHPKTLPFLASRER